MGVEGCITALVTSPMPLDDSQALALGQLLSSRLDRPVELSLTVDESVLGGLRIEVDGYLIDHTIANHLRGMKADMTRSLSDEP